MRSSEIRLRKLKLRLRHKRFTNHKAPCTAIWQQPLQSVLALRSCSSTNLLFFIIIIIIIIGVFCPREGLSLHAQQPRLQFCRRQAFQTQEPRLQFYQGLNRCGSFPLLSAAHSLFSIWTDFKRSVKIPGAPTWRWGERIWLFFCSTYYHGCREHEKIGNPYFRRRIISGPVI